LPDAEGLDVANTVRVGVLGGVGWRGFVAVSSDDPIALKPTFLR
jgi:hypothetical protein